MKLKYIKMLRTLRAIFKTFLALFILICLLPLAIPIFLHLFIVEFIKIQNEDKSIS